MVPFLVNSPVFSTFHLLSQLAGQAGAAFPQNAALLLLDSDDGEGILWLFVGAIFGVVSFFRGFILLRNKRLIENTPTSKCRSVALGLAEVCGTAQGDTKMPSLVGKIPCYCSQVRVERYVKRKKSSGWEKVYELTDAVVFQVEDDTGRVKVDPAGAELDIPIELEYSTDSGLGSLLGQTLLRMSDAKVTPSMVGMQFMNFCNSHGVSFHGRMRFFERNICPGDTVYVLGSAEALPGVADEQERVIFRKGKHHPWYVIAEASEKELLSKMGTSVLLHIYGGIALTLVCLGFLLAKFEMW